MRKLLYIAGAVVLVLLLVAVALPFVMNVNRYRPQIESAMSDALNRKVQVGNIRLSLFSGGVAVDDLAVADDPAFGSAAFLKAKDVTIGVEMMPLIFSRQVHVTGLTIDDPEVTLLRNAAGTWNFSTLGATSAQPKQPQEQQPKAANSSIAATSVSVQKLSLKNGTLTIGTVGSAKSHQYAQVDFDASDLSYTSQFPFTFTAQAPGNGTIKLTGKAGPLNAADAEQTPLDAALDVHNLDLTSTGFVDPASGIAGLVDFTGTLSSDGTRINTKGKLSASRLQLVAGSSPAKQPVQIGYETDYEPKSHTGVLKQGDVNIGKAAARLSGTYNAAGETTTLQMKLDGTNMPATDLESVLPALAVVLPTGASLTAGTLNASLTISGPVDRLVTTGPVALSNGKLSGFDMGSKLGVLSSFAGVPKGADTAIQTFSSDLRIAPEGIRCDNLNLVLPAIGSLTGNGTMSSDHALDFKMIAHLSMSANPLGGIASLVAGGVQKGGGIPFKIQGTASNPIFVPDMAGAASGLAKGIISSPQNGVTAGQDLGNALGGLLGKKKKP